MADDLKPCPFCGQTHPLEPLTDMHFGRCVAICCGGRVLMSAYTEREQEEIVRLWNTRAGEEALGAQLQAAREDAERLADAIECMDGDLQGITSESWAKLVSALRCHEALTPPSTPTPSDSNAG